VAVASQSLAEAQLRSGAVEWDRLRVVQPEGPPKVGVSAVLVVGEQAAVAVRGSGGDGLPDRLAWRSSTVSVGRAPSQSASRT
jgi:hypothetical protein